MYHPSRRASLLGVALLIACAGTLTAVDGPTPVTRPAAGKALFLHTVLFWLKPGLAVDDVRTFEQGLAELTAISSVRFHLIGRPAATRRPVVDHTYSYQLVVGFDDRAGHDLYQTVEAHERFRTTCARFWDKVVIYDADAAAVFVPVR